MVWGRKEKRTTPDEGRRHGLMKICGVGKADGTLFLYTFVPEKTKCSDAPWRNAPVMRLEQGAAAGKMKKRMMRNLAWKCILTVVCLLYGAAGKAAGREVIRVACIGNSITYGAGIANREQNSYPAQLQAYLGPDYEVRNFGVSATTLLRSGDYPYVRTAAYRQALGYITKEDVAKKLFQEIGPKYADRNGGYTRVVRIGPRRGDAAEMAIVQLV